MLLILQSEVQWHFDCSSTQHTLDYNKLKHVFAFKPRRPNDQYSDQYSLYCKHIDQKV